jgi:hypothetical protein
VCWMVAVCCHIKANRAESPNRSISQPIRPPRFGSSTNNMPVSRKDPTPVEANPNHPPHAPFSYAVPSSISAAGGCDCCCSDPPTPAVAVPAMPFDLVCGCTKARVRLGLAGWLPSGQDAGWARGLALTYLGYRDVCVAEPFTIRRRRSRRRL